MSEGSRAPLVSVVIPTYNRSNLVQEAVESALAQTYRPLEVVVVDDGSTDDTREALGRFEGRISYIYQENRGASAARNAGVENSSGPYIALLDHDDLWREDKLALQVAYLESRPECALVYTGIRMLAIRDGQEVEVPVDFEFRSGRVYPELFFRNEIYPSTVLMRRECFEEAGRFDEGLRHFEDHDLWLRLASRYEIGCIEDKLTLYRHLGGNLSAAPGRLKILYARMFQEHIATHPEIVGLLGRRRAGMRVSELLTFHAYELFDRGDLRGARLHMGEAIAACPTHLRPYLYYLACLLPGPLVAALRKMKKGLRGGGA